MKIRQKNCPSNKKTRSKTTQEPPRKKDLRKTLHSEFPARNRGGEDPKRTSKENLKDRYNPIQKEKPHHLPNPREREKGGKGASPLPSKGRGEEIKVKLGSKDLPSDALIRETGSKKPTATKRGSGKKRRGVGNVLASKKKGRKASVDVTHHLKKKSS